MIRSLILVIFGGTLLLLAVRRLKQFKLKERFTLLFLLLGLPFLLLAVWPRGIEYLARWTHIEQQTVMILSVSIFLILIVFELLTIVSVMDQKITTLAQLVGILMEHHRLVDRQHRELHNNDSAIAPPTQEADRPTQSSRR
jgi:hypothetical protein